MDEMYEVETMDEMVKRLAGCGATAQAKVVVEFIKKINKTSGCLDSENAGVALFHIANALIRKEHGGTALMRGSDISSSSFY